MKKEKCTLILQTVELKTSFCLKNINIFFCVMPKQTEDRPSTPCYALNAKVHHKNDNDHL